MKSKLVLVFMILGLLTTLLIWFYPVKAESEDERRLLSQFPEFNLKTVSTGQFMNKFEDYAKDQFPMRFKARKSKAMIRYYGLNIRENNDIYKDGKKAIKIEYPLKVNEIDKSIRIFNEIYTDYLDENHQISLSLIPDKSHYSKKSDIPKIDFNELEKQVVEGTNFASYIKIDTLLSLEDFYNTDIHWKQENLQNVAQTLLKGMKQSQNINFTIEETHTLFDGVYKGHSALPLKSDTINYISNYSIEKATVRLNDSEDNLPVYFKEGLSSRDPYDFYLYGPQALVYIENDNADTEKELIIFRDSYASSLTPYFIEHYSKITLVDIRYIPHKSLHEYIDFNQQDILFLYNTSILNSSSMFK